MEILKGYVATLVATLIFITAIEIIAPDNSMKKYLKFVLGLILISVLISPIIKFLSGGEEVISSAITSYSQELSNIQQVSSTEEENQEARTRSFINNFNRNCEKLLKEEFNNLYFSSQVDCNIDFNEMTFSINNIKIIAEDGNIKRIEEITIGDENKEEVVVENETIKAIKDFLSEELGISREKIEVYYS